MYVTIDEVLNDVHIPISFKHEILNLYEDSFIQGQEKAYSKLPSEHHYVVLTYGKEYAMAKVNGRLRTYNSMNRVKRD